MAAKKGPIEGLKQFIPDHTYDLVAPYFQSFHIQLTIKKERKRVFGDYINPTPDSPFHKISINGNLNPYSFLVTLLHELAHLVTYIEHKHTVNAHGIEWKNNFRKILLPFIENKLLPQDISLALIGYIQNIKASTCGDIGLYKTLAKYDKNKDRLYFIDEIPENTIFKLPSNGKMYQKLGKNRTRFKCIELTTQQMYLFSKVAQVEVINPHD
jgi:SprT protein